MRRTIVPAILILIFCCLPAYAQDVQLARLSPGFSVGGGVPAAGASYGVGDLLSERFTNAGSPGYDDTWIEDGGGTGYAINENATTVSGTGFVGEHLTVSGTADWQGEAINDLGGAQSAVYFRFYYRVNSESWGDGDAEMIFVLAPDGGTINTKDYLYIQLRQVATNQLRLGIAWTGGADNVDSGTNYYNINAETIYKVEGKVVDDGATGSLEWKVDGSTIGAKAGIAELGTLAVQHVAIGCNYNAAASSHSFDTVDLSSTGYLTDTP